MDGAIRARLENEVNIIGLDSMVLTGKDQMKLTQIRNANYAERDNIKVKIKGYEALIKKIENGEFEI